MFVAAPCLLLGCSLCGGRCVLIVGCCLLPVVVVLCLSYGDCCLLLSIVYGLLSVVVYCWHLMFLSLIDVCCLLLAAAFVGWMLSFVLVCCRSCVAHGCYCHFFVVHSVLFVCRW